MPPFLSGTTAKPALFRILPACCLAAALLAAAAISSAYLFQDSYANGFDGYYYALQARSILAGGAPLSDEPSIVPWFVAALALPIGNPILAAKLLGLIAACGSAAGIFSLTWRITIDDRRVMRSLAALFAALVWALSFFSAYSSYELLKNGVGNVFLAWFLYFLAGRDRQIRDRSLAALFLLLALASHKLAGGTALLVAILFAAASLWQARRRPFGKRDAIIAFACFLAALALGAIILSLSTLRVVDLARLIERLDPVRGLDRFRVIALSYHGLSIKAEFYLLHAFALAFALTVVLRFRRSLPKGRRRILVAIAASFALMLLPLGSFDWSSLSYRMMLQTTIFAPACLAWMLFAPARAARLGGAALLVAVLVIAMPGRVRQMHSTQRPDYPRLQVIADKLKPLVPSGIRLIAHMGLSYFIWYETGIPTEHFVSDTGTEGYWRLVYGIGGVYFAPYLAAGSAPPQAIEPPYYLVDEATWRRFYEARKGDLPLVSSWLNPSQPRPAFSIEERDRARD